MCDRQDIVNHPVQYQTCREKQEEESKTSSAKKSKNDNIEDADFETFSLFNFQIPKALPNVDSAILNPINTWEDKQAYQEMAQKLAQEFTTNFTKFSATPSGKSLADAGPKLN